nr:hypothetical protein [Serratia fonticola]
MSIYSRDIARSVPTSNYRVSLSDKKFIQLNFNHLFFITTLIPARAIRHAFFGTTAILSP